MKQRAGSEAAVGEAAMRRAPVQGRSRERVERILAAATATIAEGGSEALRMSAVAERAGVSIGSLYQYFPDKAAVIGTLAERFNAQGRACVEAELGEAHDAVGLRDALARLVDGYYGMFLEEPVMRDIWSGTQADKLLHEVEMEDLRGNAALIAGAMERVVGRREDREITTTALLLTNLIASTVRLAVSLERSEGDALVAALRERVLRAFVLD